MTTTTTTINDTVGPLHRERVSVCVSVYRGTSLLRYCLLTIHSGSLGNAPERVWTPDLVDTAPRSGGGAVSAHT